MIRLSWKAILFVRRMSAFALQATHTDLTNRYGLVCFSGDWIDPVLWSHYGAKHCGIALGFDLQEANPVEVTYQIDRHPLVNVDRDTVEKHLPPSLKAGATKGNGESLLTCNARFVRAAYILSHFQRTCACVK